MIKKWYKDNISGDLSPTSNKKYVNGKDRNVYFYPIDMKNEIINEIRKNIEKFL